MAKLTLGTFEEMLETKIKKLDDRLLSRSSNIEIILTI